MKWFSLNSVILGVNVSVMAAVGYTVYTRTPSTPPPPAAETPAQPDPATGAGTHCG